MGFSDLLLFSKKDENKSHISFGEEWISNQETMKTINTTYFSRKLDRGGKRESRHSLLHNRLKFVIF